MAYEWSFGCKFASEFQNLSQIDQDKILDFTDIFEINGFDDFTRYTGKIAPSWSGDISQKNFEFARKHDLWHYHVGIPDYKARHDKYQTSDWLLHFVRQSSQRIILVDLYSHYTSAGEFYFPPESYLVIDNE
ncbi:hypothetical protein [Zhongshania marina]|uniref:Uncharacterized protein n=1 Tax=Zhongshania marina TaxID=2304603 RepID=A0A2S4HGQ0_9GAMM|nr:hypothetical protein [Marortus luteolus]POP53100.1 hypothetical protein C0068_08390 [Marortus luteolus]